ncbi:MAG: S41 family peptidase [Saccharofermentanales bacterium]|jgi:carboxyl-terminal processing protease
MDNERDDQQQQPQPQPSWQPPPPQNVYQHAPYDAPTPPPAPKKKRTNAWTIILTVFLTASIVFIATAAIGYVLYGDAVRRGLETSGSTSGENDRPMRSDGRTITFSDGEGVEDALEKFETIYNLLQDQYYQEMTDAELIEKMTVGLITEMDSPYTFYLTPEYHQSVEESMSGEYVGIGAIVMRDRDNTYLVNDIIPESPAESSGLAVGDVFMTIDGVDVSTFEDVGALGASVRGEAGTTVDIDVYRPSTNEELTFTIERRAIVNVAMRWKMLEDGIGYINIKEFSSHAAEQFEAAMMKLMDEGAQHIVFDLRNNGGGYAHECINMLDVLLPPETVATTKGREDGKAYTNAWKTKTAALTPDDMTYVILLNRYSASASELFSGALVDLEKAEIVGEQSYGKGVGTLTWQMEDGSAVQITNFEYFLPSGRSIEGVGLTPDYEVTLPKAVENKATNQLTLDEDTQLQKALELLRPRVK